MNRIVFLACLLILVPLGAHAADSSTGRANIFSSFLAARSLVVASSSPGNVYAGGVSVVMTAPVEGDFSVIGGEVVVAAPVKGDGLFGAGSVRVRAPVAGDLRVVGGSVIIEEPVAGDLVALGVSISDFGRAEGSVFLVGLDVAVSNGASGPVTIYGNNVSLAGDFAGDVTVFASGHITLAEHTVVGGAFSYEAPETARIPSSAVIRGGVTFTNVSYLPNAGASRILSFVSVGFFLLVRILGALVLAGLLAGLFPRFARDIVDRAYAGRARSIFLTLLLGFAALVATPILCFILAFTFVGIGIAILVFFAYALLACLALIYAGILLGGMFARRFTCRRDVLWHDGVVGMLALSLISLVPFVGPLVVLLIAVFAAGALLIIFSEFAFPGEQDDFE